ncbi:hypothetical protein GGI17_005821 [Coemansia sp. S146]|nr:hypothetical protein GGI17_005821 [Coemansia sp. S146]
MDLIYSGIVAQELMRDIVFLRVRKIAFFVLWPGMVLTMGMAGTPQIPRQAVRAIRYPPDTEANITAFAKRIKEIAPSVTEISVTPAHIPDDVPQSVGLYFSTLVSQLFGITSRVSYTSVIANMPMSL